MTEAAPKKSPFAKSVYDTSALIFLGFSPVYPYLLIVAIGMLWTSRRWTVAEKLLATLVSVALHVMPMFVRAVSSSNADGQSWNTATALTPVLIAFYLAFRMGQRDTAKAQPAQSI